MRGGGVSAVDEPAGPHAVGAFGAALTAPAPGNHVHVHSVETARNGTAQLEEARRLHGEQYQTL